MTLTKQLAVYIPTRGRIGQQRTRRKFHLDAIENLVLVYYVVPESERIAYKKRWPNSNLLVVPDTMRIGSIHDVIVSHGETAWKLVIDDDLVLQRRRNRCSPSQAGSAATVADAKALVKRVLFWLRCGYVHGGVSLSTANYLVENDWRQINTRACACIFFDSATILAEGLQFGAVEEHQALHMGLSLLELGYYNVVDYEFMVGHNGTNAKGGCSQYRTVEFLEEQAKRLVQLHPTGVSLFYRKLKGKQAQAITGARGIPAVRIAWKKSLGIRAQNRTRKDLEGVQCCG